MKQKKFPFQKVLVGDVQNVFNDSSPRQVNKANSTLSRARSSSDDLTVDIETSSARQGLDQLYCDMHKEVKPKVFSFLGEQTIYRMVSKATPFFSSSILLVVFETITIIFYCISVFSLLCGLCEFFTPHPNQLCMDVIGLVIGAFILYFAGLLLFLLYSIIALSFSIPIGRLPVIITATLGGVILIICCVFLIANDCLAPR